MNNWYEISLIKSEKSKIYVKGTASLEQAENFKNEFLDAGLKVVIDEYVIKNEVPILVGEIK